MSERATERGMALLLALVLLVVVETGLLLLAFALVAETRVLREEARRDRLDVLADSAAEAALARLAEGDLQGLEVMSLGGGEIESRIEVVGELRFRVLARATLAGAERRLAVEVTRVPGGLRIDRWRPEPIGPAR